MQTLLPPEQFENAIDVQPIEEHLDAEFQSLITSTEHRPLVNKYSTLPEKVQNAN